VAKDEAPWPVLRRVTRLRGPATLPTPPGLRRSKKASTGQSRLAPSFGRRRLAEGDALK